MPVGRGGGYRRKGGAISLAVVPLVALAGCDNRSVPVGSRSTGEASASESLAGADNETTEAIDALFQPNALGPREHDDSQVTSAPTSLPSSFATTAPGMLAGAQIRQAVLGHELTDGVHWAWTFRSRGRLVIDENGQTSIGRWRVDRDQLCIDAGYDEACHSVSHEGRGLRLWRNGAVAIEADLN